MAKTHGFYRAIEAIAAWLWRWGVVATGATTILATGAVSALYGNEPNLAGWLFTVAILWLVVKTLTWDEVRTHPERAWVSPFIVVIGVACFVGSMAWIHFHFKTDPSVTASAPVPPKTNTPPVATQNNAPDTLGANQPTAPLVSPAEERKQREIAMGFIQQWMIAHPGSEWGSPEELAWVNTQLKKNHYQFVVTADKKIPMPSAGIHIEGVPATIQGVATVNLPIGVIANGAHSTVTGNTQYNLSTPANATEAKATPSPAAPPQIINMDHSIGGTGGTYVNPTVIDKRQYGIAHAPPAVKVLRQDIIQPGELREDPLLRSLQPPGIENPGVKVTIEVEGTFYSPEFLVTCSLPCQLSDRYVEGASSIKTTNLPDPNALQVDFDMPPKMAEGTVFSLLFRSKDKRAISIRSVASYAPPL